LAADEFCRHPWNPVILIIGPAILDSDVLALDESSLVQALPKRTNKVRGACRHCRAEKTDDRHSPLLRPRRERPSRRRAAEQRYELAASHVWMAPAWREKM
jgi:hypothetical protein